MADRQAAVEIDHLLYLTNRQHRREVNAAMRRIATTWAVTEINVFHDDDGSCCDKEPWAVTYVRLIRSLNEDGTKTQGVVVG